MGDVEMTSFRSVQTQQPSQQARYQHLYVATNGYKKDRLENRRMGKEDNQELMEDHDEYDDDDEEDDDVISVQTQRNAMELRQLRGPLEISTITSQQSSTLVGSSMSSSHYSNMTPLPQPITSPCPIVKPPDLPPDFQEINQSNAQPDFLQFSGVEFEFPPAHLSRSQVLHYFASAQNFTLRRVDRDMQITDASGFPLFDAFVDVDCCGRTWTLEAYGRLVLIMQEPMSSWCQDLARPRIPVRDWNGDFFGVILPGDPFYLHGSENKTVAKMVPQRSANGNAAIEDLAAMSLESSPNASGLSPVIPAAVAAKRSNCWLCVHENSGRHIARLEDYQSIQFNKDVAFQLKLLTLAGIIRLCGQSQLTPTSNCVGVVKSFLNCCAGY